MNNKKKSIILQRKQPLTPRTFHRKQPLQRLEAGMARAGTPTRHTTQLPVLLVKFYQKGLQLLWSTHGETEWWRQGPCGAGRALAFTVHPLQEKCANSRPRRTLLACICYLGQSTAVADTGRDSCTGVAGMPASPISLWLATCRHEYQNFSITLSTNRLWR